MSNPLSFDFLADPYLNATDEDSIGVEKMMEKAPDLFHPNPVFTTGYVASAEMGVQFLRARDYNVDAAEQMLRRALQWRVEKQPDKIGLDRVDRILRTGQFRFLGENERGEGIIWAMVERWTPWNYDVEEYLE